MNHVELHNHTTYSVLDGKSDTMEYATRAAELGMSHLAITDHGTTSGWREFQRSTKETGVKPILGIEAYLTADRTDRRTAAKRQDGTSIYNHITLLAMNTQGAENLEAMNKVAWEEGYFYKPRMDFELLEEYNEGIIALSGCMSGMIAKKYLNGLPGQSRNDAIYFKEVFGDRFYMEVMESNSTELNNYLIDLAKELGIKPVVTSDCHMARKEDLPIADAMLILNTNPKYNNAAEASSIQMMGMMETFNYLYPERQMSFQEFELWLHAYDEHVANLKAQGIDKEPVDNTMEIASRIGDYNYYEALDTLPPVEGVNNPMQELRDQTYAGLKQRGIDTPENRERIELELDVIEKKKLATYFLIEKDFIDYAKDNDILVGYGRGSAVSYLTNYCLGITKINPMPYNLLPERFLSLDRADPADVDTDLSVQGRYEVKEYAQRKYAHASNIATIGYYKDKSAIKAAAKVFKANFSETTAFTNKFDTIEEFEASPDTADYRKRYPHLVKLAKGLRGRIQNFGMHAGGIVLSKEPIEKYAPLQTAKDPSNDAKDRVPVVALDMTELADMGYVKYDLLGLRTLSIVEDTLRLIKERHGIDIDIENIDITDENIYKMISDGHTAGVFQAEASASTKVILAMGGVKDFNELVASNALVRPGAANSEVGATYLRGKLEGEYEYAHPDLKWFTEETYSAILYQEQQLLLCEHIAGMSKANANKVRKAVSKKIPEDLAIWKDEFIEGASKKVGQERAEAIWKDLEASADYAFAKAHAVGYSMLSYLTAWLKYYYSIEFLAASISWMKSSNKSDRMKLLRYMLEAKRMGIRIMLPHVNKSGVNIEIMSDEKGDYIQLGLSNIKGVGARTAGPIVAAGPWESYAQMAESPKVRANVLKALDAVGAVAFEDNPRTGAERENLFEYLSLPVVNHQAVPPEVHSQFTSLLYHDDMEITLTMGLVAGETRKNHWRRVDIADEDSSVSLFVHPNSPIEVGKVYVFLLSESNVARYIKTDELEDSGKFWEFLNEQTPLDIPENACRVISFNARKTKKGDRMAEVVFSDMYKNMFSALVFPKEFMRAFSVMREGATVEVEFNRTQDGTRYVTNVKEIR